MQWSDRIGRRLKPRDLHVFLAVAEKGNMAKAAEQLAISRPVVSKTIAELEHTLGVRLLDRTPKGVEPTLYGRALLKRSLAVFDELRQSVSDIEFLANPSAGELRVGFAEVPAAGLVHPAVSANESAYRAGRHRHPSRFPPRSTMRSRRRAVALARAGHELRTGPLRSTVRRRRSPQQMGPPAPDWPCRSRRGALDPIAARDGAGQLHLGRFPRGRPGKSARCCVECLPEPSLWFARDRSLSHHDS